MQPCYARRRECQVALAAIIFREVTSSNTNAEPPTTANATRTFCHSAIATHGQHGAEPLAEEHRAEPGSGRHAWQSHSGHVELWEHHREAETPHHQANEHDPPRSERTP